MDVFDGLDGRPAERGDLAPSLPRVGLGAVILLQGVHKVVDPGTWAAYAAPWVLVLWPLPMRPTMVAAGGVSVVMGLALIADRYTTAVATALAVSIGFVVVNLSAIGLARGAYVDVAIRDLGLVVLAVSVALRPTGGPSG